MVCQKAQGLIDEFDLDRSGTIDFAEFLTLMFKIKTGNVGMGDNKLVAALLESKNQIIIFNVTKIKRLHKCNIL